MLVKSRLSALFVFWEILKGPEKEHYI
jgi:hypothetical protein